MIDVIAKNRSEISASHRSFSESKSFDPVRVCFVIDELARAGTETQLLALINRLNRHLIRPSLVLLRGTSSLSRSLEPTNCTTLRLKIGSLCRPNSLLKAWQLWRHLRRERTEILQVYFPDSTYFAVPVAWLARIPNIVRTRNNLGHWLTPTHRLLGRLLNRMTTVTVANCAAAREALMLAEGTKSERIQVLENGVDLDRFENVAPLNPKTHSRIGVVANLRKVKGLDILIEASRQLVASFPESSFYVAGEGEEKSNLLQQIDSAYLTKHWTFLGSVKDVPDFLNRINIAVLPSRSEGMSNALLEYMAAGRAIVATDVGANSRLIEHNTHGLLVPANNPLALAQALKLLLDNPALCYRMGSAAQARAHELFSRQAMTRAFEDFFLNLARVHEFPGSPLDESSHRVLGIQSQRSPSA